MSRLWGFVVFGDKISSYPFFVWYPNLSLVPLEAVLALA